MEKGGVDPWNTGKISFYTLSWCSPTHSGRGYLWPETSVREVQRGQY